MEDHRCAGFTSSGMRCKRTTGLDENGRCYQHPIGPKPETPLTDKQWRFVEEYVRDFNATQAALRAGYAKSGAHVEGSRLLSNPKIREELGKRFEALAMEADEVVALLSDTARASMRSFVDVRRQNGQPAFVVDMTTEEALEAMRHVKKLSFDKYGNPKIELYDAQTARVHMGRIRNLFREQLDITVTEAKSGRIRKAIKGDDDVDMDDLAAAMDALVTGDVELDEEE